MSDFRFRHSTEWGKDIEIMRRDGPTRWTDEQLNELMLTLNAHGLAIVSDAIGSLRFDRAELCAREEARVEQDDDHCPFCRAQSL